jgi:phosphatidylserine decarboxylase
MSDTQIIPNRTPAEPLPDNLRSVQPGGGVCYEIELAWGRWRRWYLKRLRPRYVEQMAALRQGDPRGAPHDLLDCRDLKYCRNQCTCDWEPVDDPFRWREWIPFARWGLAELLLMGLPLLAVTVALVYFGGWYRLLALGPGVVLGLIVYFFRDPPRRVPTEPGLFVSPADGRVAEITPLDHDEFIGGAAVRIGIFLSIFNVHLNRAPARTRVIRMRYSPGLFLNAMNPQSALRNENLWIGLEEVDLPYRRLVVRQIAGLFARRIVCNLRPDETLDRGQKFGMIKLGSRTELILAAEPGLEVCVKVGDKVHAGSTVMARRRPAGPVPNVNG